jgi:hypothetical protein
MFKFKRIILFVFCFTCFGYAQAQRKRVENVPEFDRKKMHFGFTFGINSTDFVIGREPDYTRYDSLVSVESKSISGFNLGIVADFHITPVLNLRFLPSLSFAQRNLQYNFRSSNPDYPSGYSMVEKPVESTFLEFPLLLKYRSARVNNFAAYVVGGFNYRMDMASQKDVIDAFGQEIVKLINYDLAYEIGVGFDFFMEYGWKFSPELKFSFGMPNILVKDKTMWTNPINRLSSRIIVLSFHFEG